MSRVFVSCSYRDRAVGAELGSMVRALGHEPSDDHDDTKGTAWWNEVVGRIEASDVFVAVASPAYADAHACRLAAKHAAATGLPVVRVDLDTRAIPDCHPVVAAAVGVPFAPEDPETVARLAYALDGTSFDDLYDDRYDDRYDDVYDDLYDDADEAAPADEPDAPPDLPELSGPHTPPPVPPVPLQPLGPDSSESRRNVIDAGAAAVTLLGAAGLLYVGLAVLGPSGPTSHEKPETGSPASSGPAAVGAPETGVPTAAVAALLAGVRSVDSPGLPASSCRAGADAVTCTNPAPNISNVVLTPYQTPTELYAAYTAAVQDRSGEPIAENTGNCSGTETEGEVGWNLDKGHTLDFSVSQQVHGGLDPASESAGRVFCTDSQKVMSLAWTQDPGLLVTVTGQPSDMVITWWSDVHLHLACAAQDVGSGCAPSGRAA